MSMTLKGGGLLLVIVAASISVASSFTFPYVQCQKRPSAYSLDPLARIPDPSTFCFTVRVNVPADCDDYCCNEADLRKILIDINPECNVKNPALSTTINGVPAPVGPGFEPGINGPGDAYVLRMTQLGLNLTNAEGVEICVTLGPNSNGEGCITMEQLCRPPPGAPAGTCAAAMFDTKNDCCPVAPITTYLSPPPPPPPPVDISFPDECTVCATLDITPSIEVWYDVNFGQEECDFWANMVVADMISQAEEVGAKLVDEPPTISCSAYKLQVCGTFETADDAALLQPYIYSMLYAWYAQTVDTCKAYYRGPFQPRGYVDNGVDGEGCLTAAANVVCDIWPPEDWPKCKCNTAMGATPFYASPFLEMLPGRFNATAYYCFQISALAPYFPDTKCGETTTLLKAEVMANDSLRRKVHGLGIKRPGGNIQRLSASWGAVGDNTLKFTSLNWNLTQADGASLCFELERSVSINEFCLGPQCRVLFFDVSKDCCPLFGAST